MPPGIGYGPNAQAKVYQGNTYKNDPLSQMMSPGPAQTEAAQQPSADPFLEFLTNQMNIAGYGQQSQPSRNDWRSRWRSEPAPQQPSIYQQMLSQLTGYDPLLSSLLKQFQPAPEPPPISNYKFGGY